MSAVDIFCTYVQLTIYVLKNKLKAHIMFTIDTLYGNYKHFYFLIIISKLLKFGEKTQACHVFYDYYTQKVY